MVVALPVGAALELVADGETIVASTFCRRRPTPPPRNHSLLREAERQLNAYVRKRLRKFDLPLQFRGSRFELAVWRLVTALEFGEVVSYGDVAAGAGAPLAYRAVAAAMRKTPLDLLIPAHRVIGSDGRLRGAAPRSLRARLLAFEGYSLVASTTTMPRALRCSN